MSRSFKLGMIAGAGQRITQLSDQEREERMLEERTTQAQDFQREMAGLRQGYNIELQEMRDGAARRKEEQKQQSEMNILTRQISDFAPTEVVTLFLETAADMPPAEAQAYLRDQVKFAQEFPKRAGRPLTAADIRGMREDPAAFESALTATEGSSDAGAMVSAGVRATDLQTVPTGVGRTGTGFEGVTETLPQQRTTQVEQPDASTDVMSNVETGMLNGVTPLYPTISLPPVVPNMSQQDQKIVIDNIETQAVRAFEIEANNIKQRTAELNDSRSNEPNREEKRRIANLYDQEFSRIAGNTAERGAVAQLLFTGDYLDRVEQSNPRFSNSQFMQLPSTEDAIALRTTVRNLHAYVEYYGQEIQQDGAEFKVDQKVIQDTVNLITESHGNLAIPLDLRLRIVDLPEDVASEDTAQTTAAQTATAPTAAPDAVESVEDVVSGFEDTEFTQIDPEASRFVQDVQTLVQRGETIAAINHIADSLATGRYGGPAGNPLGRVVGYFRDSPEEAQQRSRAQEAVAWFRNPQNIMLLNRNPALIEEALLDPFSVIEKLERR